MLRLKRKESHLTFGKVLQRKHMAIGGTIEKFQQQSSGFAAENFAITTKFLPRYCRIIWWLRELYMFTGAHR